MSLFRDTSTVGNQLVFLLTIVAFSLMPMGCEKSSRSNADLSTKKSKTLSIGNGREPVTLDPHKASSWADLRVIEGLFEGLVLLDPVSKEPIGGVADSWESWNQGKNWRFSIRKDANWSDGSRITAHDFVKSAQRMLGPDFGSDIVVHFLYPLKNAQAFHQGQLNDFESVGIVAESDDSLLFELEYSSLAFLTQLSYFFPVKEEGSIVGHYFDGRYQWGGGGAGVSNGPYLLGSWTTNEQVVIRKNENYWDASSVSIDQIIFYPIDNSLAEERAFRSGQLQITSKVPSGRMSWYVENRPELLRVEPRVGLFFIQLNHSVPPLDNVYVRRALAKSIDRKLIVGSVLKDGKKPASGIAPAEVLDRSNSSASLGYDPGEAQELLKLAGFENGDGFPRLKFAINTSVAYQALAEAVQYGWKKNLGIEVEIVNQEWKAFLGAIESGDYQIARYGYVPLYPDPYPLFQIFTTEGTENFTGWSNSEYDQLVERAKVEIDPDKRDNLFVEAEKVLLSEAPIIPVFYYNSVYLIDSEVSGWNSDPMDRHPLKFLEYLQEFN